jgi:ABC-type transport system involved in multi-copper enzyme maturation permease subunit
MRSVQYKTMIIDTFNKEIRSKMLMFIFVLSTLIILLSNSLVKIFFSSMTTDTTSVVSSAPLLLSMMFGFLNFWSVLISTVFGVNSIRSDFSQNIIYQYLAMPIRRSDYFFSRLIGTWVIVYAFYLYAYMASLILFSMATHSWAAHSGHLLSAIMMGIFIFLCILLSTLFSFFGNRMVALLMVGISWIVLTVSNSAFRELPLNEYFSNFNLLRFFGMIVYWILPRLGNISELANSFLFKKELTMNLWIEMPHLLFTSAFLLWLGTYFIKRKDF